MSEPSCSKHEEVPVLASINATIKILYSRNDAKDNTQNKDSLSTDVHFLLRVLFLRARKRGQQEQPQSGRKKTKLILYFDPSPAPPPLRYSACIPRAGLIFR